MKKFLQKNLCDHLQIELYVYISEESESGEISNSPRDKVKYYTPLKKSNK